MRLARLAAISALCACTRGARFEATACGDGLTVILGACVPFRTADAFCGPAAKAEPGGGCARKLCGPGEALDTEHGLCVPESVVAASLAHGETPDPEDKRVPTCASGALATRGPRPYCVEGTFACARGERFLKSTAGDAGSGTGKCAAVPSCGMGDTFDEVTSTCVAIARGRGNSRLVDVGTFARLAAGTDGGEGANAFCAPVRAAGTGRPRFQIQIDVPDNDVTRASARVVARPPAATAQADAAERSMEDLVQILHFYGGTSLAASVSLEVTCSPPSKSEPTLEVPPEK